MAYSTRKQKEVADGRNLEGTGIISLAPADETDLYKWQAIIEGPQSTPYEGGQFRLLIKLSTEYPFKPPIITMETRIWHPNISIHGTICVDILKKEWSPALTLKKTIQSIITLLSEPNPDDPFNNLAADQYLEDREQYERTAASWTKQFALSPQ